MNIEKLLRDNNKKVTPERLSIYKYISNKHLFGASDIIENFPDIGRASIFRSLKLFHKLGAIKKVPIVGKTEEQYEIIGIHEHEHMECEKCGRIIDIHIPLTDRLKKIAAEKSFTIGNFNLHILGVCANCN